METNSDHTPLPPPLEITLRPFDLSDADALMSWASDGRVTRFLRRRPYTTKEEAEDYIRHHILPHPWYRAICAGPHPVGSISVKPGPTNSGGGRRASLGYRLAYEYWGRGIATATVRAASAAVLREWPELERLEAVADVENPASQRVLEKAGFQREGVLRKYIMLKGEMRDVVMYSLLPTDGVPINE